MELAQETKGRDATKAVPALSPGEEERGKSWESHPSLPYIRQELFYWAL